MLYRKIKTGEIVSRTDLLAEHKNTSFPEVWNDDVLKFLDVEAIHPTPVPVIDTVTHYVTPGEPQYVDGKWVETWIVNEYANAEERLTAAETAKIASLIQDIVTRTQKRLDDFAKTRNYDGILSACSYVDSTVTKFQTEGQYCINARDNTWATLYRIMDEVQAGTRPAPTSYEDIEPELPVLEWPN